MKYFYAFALFTVCCLSFKNSCAQYRSLEFIENQGQWEGPHLYMASAVNENVFLEKTAFTYQLSDDKNEDYFRKIKEGKLKDGTVFKYHTYRLNFLDANKNCEIVPGKIKAHYYNYFLGKDASKWKSGIHPSRVLDYMGLYNGIDMHLSSENQSLKYEFHAAPGADISQIKMRYEGQEKLELKNGILIIKTSVGDVKELKPYTYQLINGEKKEIVCEYKLDNNEVYFSFPNGYDKNAPLIIDPTVVFATFTGASADNWGFTATYDNAGNFYAGGIVHYFTPQDAGSPAPGSFPTTVGAFQTVYNGGNYVNGSQYPCDMVVFKYNAVGSAYLFATFIGGTNNDQPHSLVVDASDNLVIAGRSYSSDFPTTTGSYDGSFNGNADLVVVKLNSTGTALLGSTYIGGSGDDAVNENAQEPVQGVLKHNYGDDARSEVILDNAGNVYVAASTSSSNFPVTANAYQSSLQGGQDGVIVKLNSALTSLLWSTYLGGSSNDAAYVLSLNKQQSHLYVAGGTRSSNFPFTSGAYQSSYQGGTVDGYIGRFLNSGTYALDKMTFIGTSSYDQCYGLQIDNDNSVYAMGQTLGGTFPVTSGVYSNANSSQFIIKLDSFLTTNVYSTVFGSGNSTSTNISPVAFLVDTCQNVYVSGWGGNLGFPYSGVGNTFNMPLSVAPNLPTQSTTDGSDFYFFVLSKNAQSLLYATYMGGNGVAEHVDGGTSRFDKTGVVYQAICGGCGGSSNFPTTAGSVSTVNGSINCNLIAVKIAFQLGAVNAHALANPDTSGCAPFTVHFNNGSTNATSYSWTFGDGGSSTLDTPMHTYTIPGTYTVRMIANNPNACKPSDTVYLQIVVLNTTLNANFNTAKVDSCGPYSANFTNTSTTGATGTSTYSWNFGDGTTSPLQNPPLHVFPDTGCYTVMLIMTNPNACNSPDTFTNTICYTNINVSAGFTAPDSLCLNTPFTVTNTSQNAQSVTWNFGDGGTSTAVNPSHTYTTGGSFTITQIVTNTASCHPKDTFTKQVFVSNNYINAAFNVTKVDTCKPFTAMFDNTSSYGTMPGAQTFTKFIWSFGDGTTSTLSSPPIHTYADTGCYDIRLIMIDSTSCNSPDTIIKRICYNASFVKAAFTIPDSVCLYSGVLFANASQNATTSFWDFGDGNTSTASAPVHAFGAAGTYTIHLVAGNPNTCNKFDTATYTITISPLPTANFTYHPIEPEMNKPTSFINKSVNATHYIWSFGDGTGSAEKDPTHMYRKTNTYLVCLTAIDNNGCADTLCKRVDALINPVIDVPSAFSPNGDGQNDVLYVYGAAVETVSFKLYNRWGELVFETTSLDKGWDGKYKGKLQEMDSYAYTLYATFTDGTTASKQGNVTLLR